KSASSGCAAITMNLAGRQVCGPGRSSVILGSRSAGGALLAERPEHLCRVAVRLDLRPGPGDSAVRIDQERRADDAHVGPPERGLLAPCAIPLDDGALRVRQQRERQVE